jgi:hypothetical protein
MTLQTQKLVMMRKPVQRAEAMREVREATTGRVVYVRPQLALVPRSERLPRVWAVAEAGPVDEAGPAVAEAPAPKVELAFYRKYTEALLRRYLRLSMAAGRVPSLMGREMFRGHVTHYRAHTFEDVVIFCFDMEKNLARLKPMEQRLIARIALQQYSQGETAAMMGLSLRGVVRRYAQGLDSLTQMLLETRMLEPLKSCQGAGIGGAGLSN